MNASFQVPWVDWAALSPVIIVLGAALVGVLVEAFVPDRLRRPVQLVLAIGAPIAAVVAVAALWQRGENGGTRVLDGLLLLDGPTLVLQGMIAFFAFVAVLVVADKSAAGEDAFAPSGAATPGSAYEELARAKGLELTEVYPLVLFATGGMMLFPATGDLLTLFVALEVLSLPLYLLTGLARRRRLLSQEASLKYFLLGAFASALLLFGIGLLYGFAGSVRYADIATAIQSTGSMDPLLLAGAVLVLVGLFFKIGAVPFHQWTPDVYQGAPTPITGFMAAGTKIAAFGALLRIVYTVLPDLQWDLDPVLWTVAIATMVVGTLATLAQTDIKRMLGYSAIAHTGFVLTGIIALNEAGITAVLFYLLTYGAATVGAFAVVWLVRERSAGTDDEAVVLGEATHLSQWAGLGRRHPGIAAVFALFLLSFAGIPLTAGFIGKFEVFSAAASSGGTALAITGVLCSAVAVFFYARVIVLMFFTSPQQEEGAPSVGVTTTFGPAMLTVAVCAVLVVLLGVYPQPVLDAIDQVASFVR